MLKLFRRQIDHEDVVAQGYAALRRAALHLARGDEAEAGDLLHDTFVRFLLLRPRLDAIANLDGYLYTMLRNVYLSRQRRHIRRRAVVTDTVDIDLLAVMVDAPEPDERLRMRDDLVRLVDHACARTRVSRAASAWILRCVHGYYPAEIARLMKMPARGVDRALNVARREALEELRKPARRRRDRDGGGGRGVSGGAVSGDMSGAGGQRWRDVRMELHPHGVDDGSEGAAGPLDTLQALRVRLFASVDGACLTDDEVAGLYRSSSGADGDGHAGANGASANGDGGSGDGDRRSVDRGSADSGDGDIGSGSGSGERDAGEPAGTLLMAHVVACAGCLDRINHLLNLPPLKTRDPVESSGTRRPRRRGEYGGSDGSASGGPGGAGGPGGGSGPVGAGSVEHHGAAKGGSASRGGAGLDPLLRRTRDTIASIVDHTPRELRIAANGLELGALPVAGVVTVQELAVRLAESLAFVEIFDERGALVCYWPAQAPREGMLDDDITIDLPDGRSIELRVSLMDDCPRLRVRYTDARLGAAAGVSRSFGVGVDIGNVLTVGVNAGVDGDRGIDGDNGLREGRRAPRTAVDDGARQLRWWQRLVPSPRFAVVAGALVVLWMILIGPATTWAALGYLGRAAVEAIRTLITSERPVTQPAAAPAAPAGTAAAPAVIAPPRAGSSARVFSPSELSDLEMAVRVALHDVRADLGEDITLRATPAGVAVQGVVGGAARRDSIARALAGLDGAHVNVRTADEVAARSRRRAGGAISRGTGVAAMETDRQAGPAAVMRVEEPPPFANAIQEALAARMPAPAERGAFVNETLLRADEALAHAWALRRLAERYQPRDVTSLSPRSSESLATLIDEHTAALSTAVDVLITRVTPLVATAETIHDKAASAIRRSDAHDAASVAASASSNAGTSREPRLSIKEMFTLVNSWHADAHVLLAGARNTSVAPSVDHPDTSPPAPREWLIRLHRIQDALKQPGM